MVMNDVMRNVVVMGGHDHSGSKRNKIRRRNQVVGSLCIKYHGQELPEPFGVIISVIKKRILLPFQANISLVTELT
jgi:hypothetical protein